MLWLVGFVLYIFLNKLNLQVNLVVAVLLVHF